MVGMGLETERARVAHLLRRAGFGYTEAELDDYTALGFPGALDRLLNPERVDDTGLDALAPPPQLAAPSTAKAARQGIEEVKLFWLKRMLYTKRPLQEKLALFWHTHFATANSKVRIPALMLNQVQLFRDNALGNFEVLLQKVTRDPAMLIWLDNRQNRKQAPNENYAREVMELFTVGIGNYTEPDVKAAARAFTGYTLNKDLAFTFNRAAHDSGDKTFLGVTKNFDADDVLAALARHPATGRFLAGKLYRFFVGAEPDAAAVERLAATYTASGFDMRAVLSDLFGGPEFLAPAAYHGLVKQPAEVVIASLKALRVQNVGPDVTQTLRLMGQDLLNPPDVSGWPGGAAWVNSTTLFQRFNWADRLANGRDPKRPYFSDIPAQVADRGLSTAEDVVDFYLGLLVDGDATPEARQSLVGFLKRDSADFAVTPQSVDFQVRGMVHLALCLPASQLA